MSRVRFSTAQVLFEAFPELSTKISTPATEQAPVEFVRSLVSERKLEDAVTFCAYLLPRREAVWWACRCARMLLGVIPPGRNAGLAAAEAWVREPDDEHRRAALRVGTEGDSNDPLTWLAQAAGLSGGQQFEHPTHPVPMPPYMTARAVRVAVMLCTRHLKPDQRATRLEACVADAVQLAEKGL
jgi:hypothetical protein